MFVKEIKLMQADDSPVDGKVEAIPQAYLEPKVDRVLRNDHKRPGKDGCPEYNDRDRIRRNDRQEDSSRQAEAFC